MVCKSFFTETMIIILLISANLAIFSDSYQLEYYVKDKDSRANLSTTGKQICQNDHRCAVDCWRHTRVFTYFGLLDDPVGIDDFIHRYSRREKMAPQDNRETWRMAKEKISKAGRASGF